MRSTAARPTHDPMAEALARAPVVQTFTPEERAEVDQIRDDIQSGRATTVRHEDVPAWLRRKLDALSEAAPVELDHELTDELERALDEADEDLRLGRHVSREAVFPP